MKLTILLAPLLFLSTLLGVCPVRARAQEPVYVKEGDMVLLWCPVRIDHNHSDVKLTWTDHTDQEMDLTNKLPSAGDRESSVLTHERSLVILNVSFSHQGNYSCCLAGNARRRFWFKLTVYPALSQSRHNPEMIQYSKLCFHGESCELTCPDVLQIPKLAINSTVWHKDHGSPPASFTEDYFSSVDEKDSGVYTCTRSYLHRGRLYNMTRTTDLEVHHNKHVGQLPEIISPRAEDVFPVDLDSPAVINCTAVVYSDFDEVFWLIGKSFVERNESLPIYYNTTNETSGEQTKIKASLVIRKVSEEDLTKRYTCKLDSTTPSSNVTISLARRARPFSSSGVLRIVGFILVMVVTLSIIYVKLKIDIALFLRDTLGCYSSTPDGKSYDAYLMSYKSDTDTGLNEEDRRWLEKVLEDEFGYNLCLYDRDVLPGEAVAEAVLGCTEQSRRVVLIPCCPDPGPGSGLLSAIHAALVERQTHLVLIKTEATEAPSGSEPDSSLPEVLQLLSKAGHSVTWKGLSSQPLSSSFWKQLRYHLPAPQHPKTMAVPTDLEC